MAVNTEITVLVSKDKVKATSKGGGARTGNLNLDQLRLATMKVFEELLLNDSIQSRRHMEVLGQNLYVTLFDSDVGQLLNEKLLEVKKDRLRLQLQFELDVDREIVSLPWEFLYSPARQDFLATDVNLVLSRYLELGTDRESFTESQGPLRALVVISRPTNERTVLAKEVVNAIKGLNVEGEEPTVIVEVAEPTLDLGQLPHFRIDRLLDLWHTFGFRLLPRIPRLQEPRCRYKPPEGHLGESGQCRSRSAMKDRAENMLDKHMEVLAVLRDR